MKDKTKRLMELAKGTLSDARLLIAEGRKRSAVNRAYYAAFDAASALLHELGSNPRTHAGALSEFGQKAVNSKLVEKRDASSLRELFELRQKCDYDEYYNTEELDADELYENAENFIEDIEGALQKLEK